MLAALTVAQESQDRLRRYNSASMWVQSMFCNKGDMTLNNLINEEMWMVT